jgi:hypothetical protein
VEKRARFLGLYEPTISWTDFILSVESLLFFFLLITQKPLSYLLGLQAAIFFMTAFASCMGGISHGFFRIEAGRAYGIVWKATLLSLILNGALILLCAWYFSPFNSVDRNLQFLLAALYTLAGLFLVLFKRDDFFVALLFYVPPAIALFLALLPSGERYGLWGLGLTFVAGWVQWRKIAWDQRFLDHNTLYHCLQAVSLYFLYRWAAT